MTPYKAYTDPQLVALLQNGDEMAFREIYGRYWKRMYAMAYPRLNRTDIAEDIVQDIFVYLWEKRLSLTIVTLEHWLATAVKFRIISLVNRRLKQELPASDLPEISMQDTLLDERLMAQLVQREVNRLPEKCRLVFRLRQDTDLSNKEIAGEMGISEKAVEKHITRARRELSLSLQQLLQSLFSLFF